MGDFGMAGTQSTDLERARALLDTGLASEWLFTDISAISGRALGLKCGQTKLGEHDIRQAEERMPPRRALCQSSIARCKLAKDAIDDVSRMLNPRANTGPEPVKLHVQSFCCRVVQTEASTWAQSTGRHYRAVHIILVLLSAFLTRIAKVPLLSFFDLEHFRFSRLVVVFLEGGRFNDSYIQERPYPGPQSFGCHESIDGCEDLFIQAVCLRQASKLEQGHRIGRRLPARPIPMQIRIGWP